MKPALKNIFYSPYFILFLIIVMANWQLVFLVKGTEWDMMNFWMPWRYFMSECYNNGIVPLWNPYTQCGYPVHGDLQGPAYSPEAIVVSMLFGQNIYILNYCFVFYLFIAAVGMYKLCHFFTLKRDVSVLSGAIYALSGFNIGHGHYFYIVISVALLPWIFYYFFRILWYAQYSEAIKLSLILFWQITTGNPSFVIIAGYLLICVFLFYAGARIRAREYSILFSRIKCFGVLGVLILVMALPVVYNAMEIVPLTTRKAGLDLAYAGEESFYFENFKAFLLPLFTIPPSESGHGLWSPYVGTFAILFFAAGLFLKKDFYDRSMLFVGIAGLIIALGLELPVYPFFHKHLPFFNVFRMPNLAIIFFLMAMIIFGAKFLADEKTSAWLFSRRILLVFSTVVIIILIAVFFLARKDSTGIFENYRDMRQWIYEANLTQIVFVQGIILIAAILVFFAGNLLWKHKLRALLVACMIDVGMNYQVGAVSRIFSVNKAAEVNAYFQRFPNGFSVPAKMSLEKVSALSTGWPEYWLNTGVFLKQPDFPNSNNFELSNYIEFLLQYPRLSKNTFKNSYAFFADSLINETNFTDSLLTTTNGAITLSGTDFKKLASKNFQNSYSKWNCTEFLPGKCKFEITAETPCVFVIAQNACPRWTYYLNGRDYKPIIVNHGTFPAFVLPKGKWIIEGVYSLPNFGFLLLCSLTIFTGLLLFIVLRSENKVAGRAVAGLVGIIYLFCVGKFFAADLSERRTHEQERLKRMAVEKKGTFANNTSFDLPGCVSLNLAKNEDLAQLDSMISNSENDLTVFDSDRYFPAEAEMLLDYTFCEKTKNTTQRVRSFSFAKKMNQLLLDTLIRPESVIEGKNPFSAGIVLDSLRAVTFKEGDLFVVTGEIESQNFDFPGLSLELHFANGVSPTRYMYANRSSIKGYAKSKVIIVHKQTMAAQISKVVVSGWNTSPEKAVVHALRLRVMRRK